MTSELCPLTQSRIEDDDNLIAEDSQLHFARVRYVFSEARSRFLPGISSLRKAFSEPEDSKFTDGSFCLGPYGLLPILKLALALVRLADCMRRVGQVTLEDPELGNDLLPVYFSLEVFQTVVQNTLVEFRQEIPRSLFSPPGPYRRFFRAYERYREDLPVSSNFKLWRVFQSLTVDWL